MYISKKIRTIKDAAIDTIDKASSPTSRAGVTLERISKLAKAGVSDRAIVTLLEDNSRTGQVYTTEHVEGFKMLYQDVQSKVGVTAAQARAVLADQRRIKVAAIPMKGAPKFG